MLASVSFRIQNFGNSGEEMGLRDWQVLTYYLVQRENVPGKEVGANTRQNSNLIGIWGEGR